MDTGAVAIGMCVCVVSAVEMTSKLCSFEGTPVFAKPAVVKQLAVCGRVGGKQNMLA